MCSESQDDDFETAKAYACRSMIRAVDLALTKCDEEKEEVGLEILSLVSQALSAGEHLGRLDSLFVMESVFVELVNYMPRERLPV